jgi:4-hydroxy-2-oxoheptanedioate aldolase
MSYGSTPAKPDPLLSGPSTLLPSTSTPPPKSFVSYAKSHTGPLLGTLLSLPSPLAAKIASRSGFQWAFIDMEHAPFTPESATNLAHAVTASSAGHCLPIIRVPSHGVEWIKWALDSGASGIIIPMVNTKEEMEGIIKRAVYPPRGQRSFGPFQAPFGQVDVNRGVGEYFEYAREGNVAILPIIESKEAVENCEEILGVEGVSGCFIGPYDLRLSLGLPGGVDGEEEVFKSAMAAICGAAKKLGKVVGSMGVGESCIKGRKDMDFLLVSIDVNALGAGYRGALEEARRGLS